MGPCLLPIQFSLLPWKKVPFAHRQTAEMDSRCVNMECLLSLVCSILATAPSYSRMLFPAPQENCPCLRVLHRIQILFQFWGKVRESFPGGSIVQNPPANVGDTGSLPGSPGEGNGNPPWKITQTEEPGELQSVGSQRSWTQLSNSATTATKRRPLVTTACCRMTCF